MSDRPRSLMLFAAGFGTRMGALARDRPKPLIRVAGKALIDHALDLAAAVAPDKIVANAHYKAEMLADHLRQKGVDLSVETPDILDTGGGLKHALPLLGAGPVFTMNSDAIWVGPNPLELLARAWDPEKMDALLACVRLENCIGRAGGGDFTLDADGRITRGGDMVYGGAQILKTDRVAAEPESVFSLNRIWDAMAADGRLYGLACPGQWCDIGTPDGIGLAENLLSETDV